MLVSILSRQALQGASFVDVKQLREAIDHFICAYNDQAAPFEWRQTEIQQQPLRENMPKLVGSWLGAVSSTIGRTVPARLLLQVTTGSKIPYNALGADFSALSSPPVAEA